MAENIRSIFTSGKGGNEQDFFSVFETSDTRLDLRFAGGLRCSLPYMHLHAIQYAPEQSQADEELLLHYPAFSMVRIFGKHLLPLYEALNNQRVSWLREKGADEEYIQGKIFIVSLEYSSLTDWRVEAASLRERQRALLSE